jgi:hypothetical protein
MLFSCAVRPPLTFDSAVSSLAPVLSADTVRSLLGSGSIVFARGGEEFSASFDIKWNGDSSFAAQFYGPLGITIAAVRSITAARWLVSAGDSQYTQHPSQRVSVGQGSFEFPLSWQELLGALTLRYPCLDELRGRPDTMFTDKKTARFVWRSRRCSDRVADISVALDNKTDRLSEISYGIGEKERSTLIFRDFRDGRAKEIRFVPSDNNYFYVTYHSLSVNSRKVRSP